MVTHAHARLYEPEGNEGDTSFLLWIPIAAAIYAGTKWGTKQAVACGAIGLAAVVAYPFYAMVGALGAVASYFLWSLLRR